MKRFPSDFMFEMSTEEFREWRSQFVTSNEDKMGLRYPPFCFTEHDKQILVIFEYLKQLEQAKKKEQEQNKRKRVGYKRKDEQ